MTFKEIMTFKEKFPELKNSTMIVKEFIKINSIEAYSYSRAGKYLYLSTADVQKFCLSKQRVKEAIIHNLNLTKRFNEPYTRANKHECEMRLNDLLKELGI